MSVVSNELESASAARKMDVLLSRRLSHPIRSAFWGGPNVARRGWRSCRPNRHYPYMKRFVLAALGVLPRQSGRADSVRHLRESAELKEARRRAIESLRERASTGTPLPINIRERLRERARTLEFIERRREEEDNPYIGLNVEERILASELRDLALATLADEMEAL